jgi:prephenate dehydratase
LRLALEELEFHSAELIILGSYPASPFRETLKRQCAVDDDAPRSRA